MATKKKTSQAQASELRLGPISLQPGDAGDTELLAMTLAWAKLPLADKNTHRQQASTVMFVLREVFS